MESTPLSVVIVTHDSRHSIARALPPLLEELRDADELIIVDNRSSDGTAEAARELAPRARILSQEENLGYGCGCNAGAAQATGELMLFLNPDATVQPGFRDAIELPVQRSPEWAAWQGLVTSGGGTLVNSTGGVVHYTGIAWAGGDGVPLEHVELAPCKVGFASGTCLAIRRERWEELGGFPEEFFLYHEDVDLSLRLRLAGHKVGIEPTAVVEHLYEFDKGPSKWRYLERNRWATIIRTYPAGLIAVLMPALLATELALLPIALAGGWLRQKLRSWVDLTLGCPRLLGQRRALQRARTVSAGEFARPLSPRLDSQHLGAVGRSRPIDFLLRAYWSLARVPLRGARE